MSIRTKIISVVALALLLAACGGNSTEAPKTPQKQVNIEYLGWIIENRDPNLSASGVTARLRTYIYLADTGLEVDDFASVEITGPSDDGRWFFEDASEFGDNFDSENDVFRFNLVDSDRGGGAVMPLGDFVVTLRLKNGNTSTETLSVPAPGSKATDGYDFVYTEDYSNAANPPSNYASLPKRANVESATFEAQTLNVSFSVTDDTIYSGWMWFYDEAGEYIGYAGDFKDYETGELMPQLNAGTALLTDGVVNTLSASAEALKLEESASLSDIASVQIVLTDGEQYADTERSSYDTRSISSKFEVSVNQ